MKKFGSLFLASFALASSTFASHFPDCSINQFREKICKGDSVKVSGFGRRSIVIGKVLKFVDYQGQQTAVKIDNQITYVDIKDIRLLVTGRGNGYDFEYNEGGGRGDGRRSGEGRPGLGHGPGPILPLPPGRPGTFEDNQYGNYYSPSSPYQWALAHDIARNGDYRTFCYAFASPGQVLNSGNPVSDNYCLEAKRPLGIFKFRLADDIARNGDYRTFCYGFSGRGELLNQGNPVPEYLCLDTRRDLAIYQMRLAHDIAHNGDYRTFCYAFNPSKRTVLNQGNPVESRLCYGY